MKINTKKINLGSGDKKIPGFINVDKYNTFDPDVVHDLETFPYPFSNDEVDEIKLIHVLEHLGQTPDIFVNIMKELIEFVVIKLKYILLYLTQDMMII